MIKSKFLQRAALGIGLAAAAPTSMDAIFGTDMASAEAQTDIYEIAYYQVQASAIKQYTLDNPVAAEIAGRIEVYGLRSNRSDIREQAEFFINFLNSVDTSPRATSRFGSLPIERKKQDLYCAYDTLLFNAKVLEAQPQSNTNYPKSWRSQVREEIQKNFDDFKMRAGFGSTNNYCFIPH